jgi:hypothetical protein
VDCVCYEFLFRFKFDRDGFISSPMHVYFLWEVLFREMLGLIHCIDAVGRVFMSGWKQKQMDGHHVFKRLAEKNGLVRSETANIKNNRKKINSAFQSCFI